MKLSTCVCFAILFGITTQADPWKENNDPALMDFNSSYDYQFSNLPLQAELDIKPWSETYWASSKGSINIRWNTPGQDGFKYKLHPRYEVMQMSKEELSTLSPAEKWDLYMGNYDYPLHKIISKIASRTVADWHGLCDGWSMAAVQYAEPQPKEVMNPDGLVIPFGSSDIKGLLAYVAQMRSDVEVIRVGGQCGMLGHILSNASCDDINPGALHVILANQIGLMKKAFMMDRDPAREIWNQPIYGYKTTVMGSAKSKAARGVLVHTTIYYTDELEKSSWQPVGGTEFFKSNKIEMDYVLDLDYSGRIVGGKYEKNSPHPDLFWITKNGFTAEDEFSKLKDLAQ